MCIRPCNYSIWLITVKLKLISPYFISKMGNTCTKKETAPSVSYSYYTISIKYYIINENDSISPECATKAGLDMCYKKSTWMKYLNDLYKDIDIPSNSITSLSVKATKMFDSIYNIELQWMAPTINIYTLNTTLKCVYPTLKYKVINNSLKVICLFSLITEVPSVVL
jgi:hypothetical protein